MATYGFVAVGVEQKRGRPPLAALWGSERDLAGKRGLRTSATI